MATAKHRALDHLRRGRMLERKHQLIAWDLEEEQQAVPDVDSALEDDIGDELGPGITNDLRPHHRGDRQGLLAARGDDRTAHRSRKADPLRIGPGL